MHNCTGTTFTHNTLTGDFEIYSSLSYELLVQGTSNDIELVRAIDKGIRKAEKIAFDKAIDIAGEVVTNIKFK